MYNFLNESTKKIQIYTKYNYITQIVLYFLCITTNFDKYRENNMVECEM